MFCEQCGQPLDADARFCASCGAARAESTSPAPTRATGLPPLGDAPPSSAPLPPIGGSPGPSGGPAPQQPTPARPLDTTSGFGELVSTFNPADWTIVGGAAGLFLSSFFGWYGTSFGYSRNGWHYFLTGIVPVLIGIALAVHVVLRRLGVWSIPKTSLPLGVVEMIVGGVAAALVLIRLIAGDDVSGYQLDRKFGLFLALLAALALVAGGFVRTKIEPDDGMGASPST